MHQHQCIVADVRTTVTLDDDVYEAAQAHAQATGKRLGRVLSEMARQAFQPFLAGLQKLRTALENDPHTIAAPSTKELVHTTAENGRQVEGRLAAIQDELKGMAMMLTPAKSVSKY